MSARRLSPAARQPADHDRRAALEELHERLRTAVAEIELDDETKTQLDDAVA